MMLATGMMYGGAVFVLVFDNPVIGITVAALNFLFWTWVVGFFVMFSKASIGPISLRLRLIISMFFWLSFCSKRFNDWLRNEFKKGEQHESAIYQGSDH